MKVSSLLTTSLLISSFATAGQHPKIAHELESPGADAVADVIVQYRQPSRTDT